MHLLHFLLVFYLFSSVVAYSFFETFKSKVCDRVIDPRPKRAIIIRYGTQITVGKKTIGKFISVCNASKPPTLEWSYNKNDYYMLIMLNPDAPSEKHTRHRKVAYVHWMVANIRENNICSGLQVAEYWGPDPPKGAGCRRYLFLVYKQKKRIQLDRMPECARYDFDIRKFAKGKFWMKNIVAGNLFISKNSD